jgi:hypothetical protein
MTTYTKTHSSQKALNSHLAKIKKRGGKATVKGKTIEYKFGGNDKKFYMGGKLPKGVYTKEQVNKKYKGKYISFNQTFNYNTNQYEYDNIKVYKSIHEDTTLGEDVGTDYEYRR